MARAKHNVPKPDLRFAEFFAGIGLMRLGLERQGWQAVFANDIDPKKHEIYLANFPDTKGHFWLGDIHQLAAEKVPDITLATASFPCNDLSLAGPRAGLSGKNSSAFWGFINVLKALDNRRPRLVLIENVPGFLTSRRGADFLEAMRALNDLGYTVDPFILDAAWFVPQSRQRLFVLATRTPPSSALTNVVPNAARPNSLTNFIRAHPEIKWSLRTLPEIAVTSSTLADIVEQLPEDAPEWWRADRAEYLINQMSSRHRNVAEELIRGRRWTYGTVFRRIRHGKSMAELRTDGRAGCLRTPRGGSGRQILFKAGYGRYRVRLLTPRECGRLMGAEPFATPVSMNQALFGFGDAVCVPVIEWIAANYLKPLLEDC